MQQQQQSTTVVTIPAAQTANVQYVAARPPPPSVYPQFPKSQALGTGIALIVAGSLSIIFNIVELAVGYSNNYIFWEFGAIGHGFWVGILCIIPGVLGLGAGIYKTRCRICAFNVMCVIAASFTLVQFIIAIIGATVGPNCSTYNYNYYGYYTSYYINYCQFRDTAVAMEALETILAVIEAVAAIWGSAICCRTFCCCSCCVAGPRQQVMAMQPVGTQMTVATGNQQMMTVQQPGLAPVGYPNVAYQPGYPGQPVQFTALPPGYPAPQGQFIPAGPPGYYPGAPQYVQQNNQPVFNVQPYPPAATAPQMPTADKK